MYTIYLLWHPIYERTYIGITTDLKRRLRQHNKEIVGGAKSTVRWAPNWTVYCKLEGFENRSVAMRWEKLLKLRSRGLLARRLAFLELGNKICPPGKNMYIVPDNIVYSKESL